MGSCFIHHDSSSSRKFHKRHGNLASIKSHLTCYMFSRNLGILDKKKQGFVRLDMNVGPTVSVVVYKGWSFKCEELYKLKTMFSRIFYWSYQRERKSLQCT